MRPGASPRLHTHTHTRARLIAHRVLACARAGAGARRAGRGERRMAVRSKCTPLGRGYILRWLGCAPPVLRRFYTQRPLATRTLLLAALLLALVGVFRPRTGLRLPRSARWRVERDVGRQVEGAYYITLAEADDANHAALVDKTLGSSRFIQRTPLGLQRMQGVWGNRIDLHAYLLDAKMTKVRALTHTHAHTRTRTPRAPVLQPYAPCAHARDARVFHMGGGGGGECRRRTAT
ncbi:hypothetical protein EON67_02715 [archaeon]|nr:MAG: hypothetical protein EON67_02715 [archaeon]